MAEEVLLAGDSLTVKMPVFDSEFRLKILANGQKLSGVWLNHARKTQNSIAFTAQPVVKQMALPSPNNLSGKWETWFSPDKEEDKYPAIGEFRQQKGKLAGTFLTETGDYRFLEGRWTSEKDFYLACFDGSHAFLFTGSYENDQIRGVFYSGSHWQEPWLARRNPAFQLRAADSITFLKPGYTGVSFTFPDLEGKKVSFPSKATENKVVIVQLMGSWCPNCMDETKLLTEWYKQYHSQGLEIIGLAYERSEKFDEAARAVSRLKQHFAVPYPLLIGGISAKKSAAETLPMLNEIAAYPTTIFIDRAGRVRKIHTGFSGPGTGKHYTDFVKETEAFIAELLGK